MSPLTCVTHIYLLQQKKRQKTLAKIKQLTEEEDSNTRAVQQKGKSKGRSRNRNQTKGGKDAQAAKKTSGPKSVRKNAPIANCNIQTYFAVKK